MFYARRNICSAHYGHWNLSLGKFTVYCHQVRGHFYFTFIILSIYYYASCSTCLFYHLTCTFILPLAVHHAFFIPSCLHVYPYTFFTCAVGLILFFHISFAFYLPFGFLPYIHPSFHLFLHNIMFLFSFSFLHHDVFTNQLILCSFLSLIPYFFLSLEKLGWRKLDSQRSFKKSIDVVYKSPHGLDPNYLQPIFVDRSSITNYSLMDIEGRLAAPRSHANYLKNSFGHSGAVLYVTAFQSSCGKQTLRVN